jgi:hypothetical protein
MNEIRDTRTSYSGHNLDRLVSYMVLYLGEVYEHIGLNMVYF